MTEGWVWLINMRKAHYMREGMSLCRKWAYLGSMRYDPDDNPRRHSADDCRACRRKLDAEDE